MPALDYTLSLDDLLAFTLHHVRRSPHARRGRSLTRAALGVVLACLLAALGFAIRAPAPFFVAGAAVWLFWFLRFPRSADRQLRAGLTRLHAEGRNLGVLGPHHFEVEGPFWSERTPWREVRTHVAAVEKLVDAPEHFFLYVSADAAIILPKRAFASEAAARGFFEALQSLHAKGQAEAGENSSPP